jgi:hypothetical protein
MTSRRVNLLLASMAVVCVAAWQLALFAQQPGTTPGRFHFQVVESFDAKYLGDTPGHVGRGSLGSARPDLALGDPVFRNETRIGKVTSILWDRTKDSLQVEFDPEPFEADPAGRPVRAVRITVGVDVWVPLGGEAGARDTRKAR